MLVVDKPEGPTSHDVVDRARRALGQRRIGHTGTLDPLATGVLPLCLGRATRLASFLSASTKVYDATLRLGFATTTDDRTGEPLAEPRVVSIQRQEVEAACGALLGEIEQLPPAFSAKKVGGKRLYALARRGETALRRPARVTIVSLEVAHVTGDLVGLRVRCSAGAYMRALARDLGAALGVGGHLTALRRTESAGYGLDGAVSWPDLGADGREALLAKVHPLNTLLAHLPALTVTAEGRAAVRHGRRLGPEALRSEGGPGDKGRVRLVDEAGVLLALAVARDGHWHPHLVLVD